MKMTAHEDRGERGFSLVEVAVAAVISMISLVFLASLFTIALTQNQMNNKFTSTTALAQEKMEELNAIEFGDARMNPGGDILTRETVGEIDYFDDIYVDPSHGEVRTGADIPEGESPHFRRYWRIENDPELLDAVIICVRVESTTAGKNTGPLEETVLTTVRSH